jgi:uncharacterized YigZ family protein
LELIDSYKTLEALSEGIYKEKGSKFIALAVPCYSENEAKNYLNEWRKLHHQARHLCYAYRFGLKKDIYRANDDGEPSNSAGMPILGQIQSFELTNVLIGVVRYYGGTKLGVGGLIHAYKTAAREAIELGSIIEKKVFQHLKIKFSYAEMPEIMNVVKTHQLQIETQDFQEVCLLQVAIPLEKKDYLTDLLSENKHVLLEELGIY